MPTWRYTATIGARTVQGQMNAPDREALVDRLLGQGASPLHIDLAAGEGSGVPDAMTRQRGGPSEAAVAAFIAELADLTGAGVMVEKALGVIAGQPRPPAMKAAVDAVLADLRAGFSLASAMERRTGAFTPAVTGVIRAGESSGALPEVLERLATTLERSRGLKETVRSALIYPAVLVALVVACLGLMVFVVLPQFEGLFEDAGDAVPAASRMVMDAAAWLRAWWWLPPLVLVLGIAALTAALRSPAGGLALDRRLLRIPLIAQLEAAHLCRLLGTLIENGVPLARAVDITRAATGNRALGHRLSELLKAIKGGRRLAVAISDLGLPPVVGHLVSVGEETGRLGPMLHKAAAMLESSANRSLARAMSLLVPLLTIVLGMIVAGVMGAVLSALLSVYDMPM